MTIQTINIGNVVNDGLGDDLRSAFQKVNANFSELSASLTVTASNAAGTNGEGIVATGSGSNLTFKNLLAGTKILLEGFNDSIRINSTQPDAFTRIDTNLGAVSADEYEQITIQGGSNVNVKASGQVITVDTNLDLNYLLMSYDFGPVSGGYSNVFQLALAGANIDFGTISNPGDFTIDLGGI